MTKIISSSLLLASLSLTLVFADHHGGGGAHPFNGKDLTDWSFKAKKNKQGKAVKPKWVLGSPTLSDNPSAFSVAAGEGAMVNTVSGHGQSLDIYSNAKFGSSRIEVEFMVAEGANSGVYLMGEYEVQIFDSYGKTKMGNGDMGAVYGAAPPAANGCKKPGEWQTYLFELVSGKFS